MAYFTKMPMKIFLFVSASAAFLAASLGLVVRHDVAEARFIELAKRYPQLCHLPMGEATLIDSCWILTAGHVGRDLSRDMANGYSPTMTCNGRAYRIERVVIHPLFGDTPEGIVNDVALAKVGKAVTDVPPAELYSQRSEIGLRIVLAGMGDIGTGLTGPRKQSTTTRAATNVVDGADSAWIRFTFDAPGSKNVTELEGVSGPGDSGGPAFCDIDSVRYVVGVSSHQMSTNGKGRYGAVEYYSRVSAYRDWIMRTIGRQ
jgi:hypothetical protein